MLLRSGYDCLVSVVEPGGEELVGRRKKVAVAVHCDADVRVAEAYGDRLRVRPDGDEQARAGVAEIVKSESVFLRRQGSPDCGLERPPVPKRVPHGQAVRAHRATRRAAELQVAGAREAWTVNLERAGFKDGEDEDATDWFRSGRTAAELRKLIKDGRNERRRAR